MAHEDLKRLSADLSTLRGAMRFDKPYANDDIPIMLLLALGGLLAIPLLEFTGMDPRICLLLGSAPALVQFFRKSVQRRRDRAARPNLWQEIRLSLIALAVVFPLALGWLMWSQNAGSPLPNVKGSILFFIGVGTLVIGILDANRRTYLAGGVVMLVFGLSFPWLSPQQVPLVGAVVLVVVGLAGAAIIKWQLRRDSYDPIENKPPQ